MTKIYNYPLKNAWTFGSTLRSTGIYRRICELHYGEGMNCDKLNRVADEDKVQERNAEWFLYTAIAYFIPALFSDTLLGAYADRNGRKIVVLLGLVGISISEFGYLLVLSYLVNAPFWIILIFDFCSGLTGFITMIPVSCNAYLSDITQDGDILTIRLCIFSMFQSFASIIGAVVAGIVYKLDILYAIDIELFIYFLTFLYVLWRIPQKPGAEEIARRYASGGQKRPFLRELRDMLKEGFNSYVKRRMGYRRCYIFVSVIVLMISSTISEETRISMVMNSYVFRRTDKDSLDWDQRDLGYWNGSGFAINLVGTLIGLCLFKQVLRLRETTMIIIGLLSSIARSILIALATKWWYMYVANACGLFVGLIQPAIASFLRQVRK
ncbi:unnamed protein product [Enterobius vermicularis]|uniref:MFS domain-containing protein n=1 Tax=Enterobius vermicularis TaxID=51028 RepID=A0A158Q9D7_ENTVE|nr:unnamed protein product [Enterobius vermicularis]